MKAIVDKKFGLADVLHLEEVIYPSPRDDQALKNRTNLINKCK